MNETLVASQDALREALSGMVRRVNAVLANPRDGAALGDLDGYTDAIAAQFLPEEAEALDAAPSNHEDEVRRG